MSLPMPGQILAEADREMRNIFIIVVAVVWIVSAIANAIKRAAAQQKTRQDLQATRAEIERNLQQRTRSQPVQLAPDVARRVPPIVPGRAAQQRRGDQSRPAKQKRAQPPRTPARPPAAPFADAQVAQTTAAEIQVSVPRPAAAKRTVQASAPALQTWLRPATLRQQFILTEIFQPPLALRDPGELPAASRPPA